VVHLSGVCVICGDPSLFLPQRFSSTLL